MITVDSRMIVLMMSFILSSDFVSGFFVEEWREGRPRGRGWCFRKVDWFGGWIGTTSATYPHTLTLFIFLPFVPLLNLVP